MHHLVSSRRLLAIVALSCVSATAVAQNWSDTRGLAVCPGTLADTTAPVACLLPLQNGDFEAPNPGPWVASEDNIHGIPLPLGSAEAGRGLAAVLDRPGFAISQTVALPRIPSGGGQEATYVLRFAAHGEDGAPVALGYRLSLVDQGWNHLADISSNVVNVGADEAEHAFRIPGRSLPDGATLRVTFYREADASPGAKAYVDDVAIILRDRR